MSKYISYINNICPLLVALFGTDSEGVASTTFSTSTFDLVGLAIGCLCTITVLAEIFGIGYLQFLIVCLIICHD